MPFLHTQHKDTKVSFFAEKIDFIAYEIESGSNFLELLLSINVLLHLLNFLLTFLLV